jgi:hypothetical protein
MADRRGLLDTKDLKGTEHHEVAERYSVVGQTVA